MAVTNRQIIADVLTEAAYKDKDILVLCSDSRGSGSMTGFFETHPAQAIEVGIAEQDLVSISAGLASCGKKPYAVSPASFLSSRSVEQIKIDVCYSRTNVKLIGISGGVSYGALGMSHHGAQDIAMISAIPNIRVYIPSDQYETRFLMQQMVKDNEAAYIRVSRNPSEDVYAADTQFEFNKAKTVCEGNDATIIACGEFVSTAKKAAGLLKEKGINVRVLDMYCIKPIDKETIIKAAGETGNIITIEEHSVIGGLGSMVASVVTENCPCKMKILGLPDEELICGSQTEIFEHENLTPQGVADEVIKLIKK
ncbi:MAG: transketolase family protein [Erysipelotrichaceae bacterium]|nr:transketolase family protein [Erysipelotrichaceae bacterium]